MKSSVTISLYIIHYDKQRPPSDQALPFIKHKKSHTNVPSDTQNTRPPPKPPNNQTHPHNMKDSNGDIKTTQKNHRQGNEFEWQTTQREKHPPTRKEQWAPHDETSAIPRPTLPFSK